MKKIINTYEDYLKLSQEEAENLDIDLYSDEELKQIAQFMKRFGDELLSVPELTCENKKIKFSSLKEHLEYFKNK